MDLAAKTGRIIRIKGGKIISDEPVLTPGSVTIKEKDREAKERIKFRRWLALMAWRDSRKNRSRLFLFISVYYPGHCRPGGHLFPVR
jgi:hypothetical protein